MKSLAVAALALLIPQSTDSADAAALFRKFEKALVESKGLEVSFSSTIDVKGKKTDRLEGKFRLAKENKAVIEASGTLDEKDFSIKIVSDGNNLKMTVSGKDDLGTIATPQGFNQGVVAWFARASAAHMIQGIHRQILDLHNLQAGSRSVEPVVGPPATAGHFKMGEPETLASGVKVLQIQFVVAEATSGDRSEVALFVGKENLAPAKRNLVPLQERGAKITETYSRADYDAKFGRDAFKIANK